MRLCISGTWSYWFKPARWLTRMACPQQVHHKCMLYMSCGMHATNMVQHAWHYARSNAHSSASWLSHHTCMCILACLSAVTGVASFDSQWNCEYSLQVRGRRPLPSFYHCLATHLLFEGNIATTRYHSNWRAPDHRPDCRAPITTHFSILRPFSTSKTLS